MQHLSLNQTQSVHVFPKMSQIHCFIDSDSTPSPPQQKQFCRVNPLMFGVQTEMKAVNTG